MRAVKERMNLYITKSLMDDLRNAIPARERTRFVEDVLARELRRRKLLDALEKAYGAWTDENHPEMKTFADINRWVEDGRKRSTRDFSPNGRSGVSFPTACTVRPDLRGYLGRKVHALGSCSFVASSGWYLLRR